MLGGERDRLSERGSYLLGAVVITKALRALSLVGAATVLKDYNWPIVLLLFYVLSGSSIAMSIQRPWSGKRSLTPQQWSSVIVYAVTLLFNYFFFFIGLKYYGPLRSVLSYDYADVVCAAFFTTVFSAKGRKGPRLKGAAIAGVAYVLLYIGYSGDTSSEVIDLWLFSAHTSHLGVISIAAAVILCLLRRNLEKVISPQIGGKRLHCTSSIIASVMCLPLALTNLLYFDGIGLFTAAIFPRVVAIIAFTMVMDYYVESHVNPVSNLGHFVSFAPALSLAVSCVTLLVVDYASFIASPLTLLAAIGCVLVGVSAIYAKNKDGEGLLYGYELPRYGGENVNASSMAHFLISSFRTILSGKESRRIFLYLCLTLGFMFVEMVYGLWTNSLSLISDACHMLFDSTALVIGLFASIISKWSANKMYSYGYGRVEVLSGFINGIFLVFIAFVVLLESMERFYSPQEVNTESLLTVSVLGLLVNLVGVVAFHDLHGGGEHGHSHSHGHSHGHDHGHGEKKAHSHGHSDKKAYVESREDSNLYGVYLHIIADTLGSVGVIVSCLLISWKGWVLADPICSFIISLMILVGVIPLIRSSGYTLLQTTPSDFEGKMNKGLKEVTKIDGVVGYHNPHFWKQSSDMIVGTLKVEVDGKITAQQALAKITKIFKKKGVKEMTVEIQQIQM
ncbi:hypothetical protein PROFUN_05079 [Planoprotostelium fungivorum]|uniref:Cation efflux protein transmembrane domain-containing protein n=1 Tax=Planoprotostelium fungivorum TaxID=1890364 RepID=A0A2P6NSB2_9EUKA|nr:hypothetical protein PROFUN_05079 [Planoprotostelium fungivorum]